MEGGPGHTNIAQTRTPATWLRALRHRNYRLYFSGQSISLIGNWMTRLTTHWLMWRLTQSADMLGLLAFVNQVPSFVLSPLAGVWVDRLNKYHLLIATQTLLMGLSFTLAALVLTDYVEIWHIFFVQGLQGIITAFDMPTRQALLVELIEDRADLPNAIALNSTTVNAARLIGPSVAGLLIAAVGEGWCFFLDGLSYVVAIASLLAMHVAIAKREPSRRKVIHELVDGFAYVRDVAAIRAVLLLLALVGLFGMPYMVLLPVIAANTLGGGPHTLGFLMGAMGLGALGSAVYLASRASVVGLDSLVAKCAALFGLSLVVLGLSRSLPLSLLTMVLTGVGFMITMAGSNTILQALVREDMRGRVMALFATAIMGMAPFGSLLAGFVADRIGAPITAAGCGLACLIGAIVFGRRGGLRAA